MSNRRPFEGIYYGQLYDYLSSLGYRAQSAPTHVVYTKSGARLPVVLPRTSRTEEVPPSHLAAVGRILELDGIIPTGHLTFPLGRAPRRRRAAKAKATSTKAAKARKA